MKGCDTPLRRLWVNTEQISDFSTKFSQHRFVVTVLKIIFKYIWDNINMQYIRRFRSILLYPYRLSLCFCDYCIKNTETLLDLIHNQKYS